MIMITQPGDGPSAVAGDASTADVPYVAAANAAAVNFA